MACIAGTGTALPPYFLDAGGFRTALARAFAPHFPDLRPLLRMADHCGVSGRYLGLPIEEVLQGRPLGESNAAHGRMARSLGARAAAEALRRAGVPAEQVDVVVTTCCTGYMLPSLDAHLVADLGLRADVVRLPITVLGCLAGAASLARASELLDGRRRKTALVVAVELPSLTFQPADGSMDNLVSSLVFADGAGAAVLQSGAPGLEIVDARSLIVPNSLGDMGFELREGGFHVVLSKDVPALLGRPFAEAVETLLCDHGLGLGDLAFACIHPGGPKILRAVDAALGAGGLTATSWEVLDRFGNQSSAAVFFVLDRLLRCTPPAAGSFGLLAGFGPGLSLELSLLRQQA